MTAATIGIDIGGTYTKFGLVAKDGSTLFQDKIPTQKYKDFRIFIRKLDEAIKEGINSINDDLTIIGVGVGAPNANFYRGTIENAPNLPWKGIVPIVEIIEEDLGYKVVITNDANAAAIGEMTYGSAKGMKDFIVITLGTGLGSGIVSNGQLINGHDSIAGELGHTLVTYNGRFCNCGKRGCLETYVSATGIKRTVYKLLADYLEPSELREISFDDLSTKMITEAAERDDIVALEAFEYTGRILGTKLSDAIQYTNPEAIFLLGGLSRAGKYIFKPTIEHMEKNLMPIFKGKVKVLPSGLENQSAPIIGAASLVWTYIIQENPH
ncbi:MAG: ROK family protein [Bacteroidota bacterium]